jgi:aspartate carbamoyltransferase catalytic subunit
MQHILQNKDITKEFIKELFVRARDFSKNGRNLGSLPLPQRPKIMASFFGEPSTRTRLSFESAMWQIGGKVITAADASASSSLKKGESFKDTIASLCHYADIIVARFKDPTWVDVAREHATVPVISGGNGSEEHPTQALLDLYCVWKRSQTHVRVPNWECLENKTWVLCGDLRYSRTIHSLVPLLKLFSTKIVLNPDSPEFDLETDSLCGTHGYPRIYQQVAEDWWSEADVMYMTRSQVERHGSDSAVGDRMILDAERVNKMKESALILHPLPRGMELPVEVDADKRAIYLKDQMSGGVHVRAALLELLLRE